jgi:ParB family transcriptional regulator, chromosome partitioning protein
MTTRRIDEIVVGERHRRNLGDIASLAANVAELGLLHPIVIRPDGTLIAGERRPNRAADLSRRHLAIRSPNRVRKGSPR